MSVSTMRRGRPTKSSAAVAGEDANNANSAVMTTIRNSGTAWRERGLGLCQRRQATIPDVLVASDQLDGVVYALEVGQAVAQGIPRLAPVVRPLAGGQLRGLRE